MGKYEGLDGRKNLIGNLVQKYSNQTAEKIIYIQAEHGQGKTYIVEKVISELLTAKINIDILEKNCEDLVLRNGPKKANSLNAISLSGGAMGISLGLGVGWANSDTIYSKIQGIFSSSLKKSILICIDGVSDCSDSLRLLINYIMKCIPQLETKKKKKIFFLFTDTQPYSDTISYTYNANLWKIKLSNYGKNDVSNFLRKYAALLDFSKSLDKIFRLSNGNLKLAKFLYDEIVTSEKLYIDTLGEVIDIKLSSMKEKGNIQNISDNDIEDIIYSSSLSLRNFSSYFIENIIKREQAIVTKGLEIAKTEDLVDKDLKKRYFFILEDVQDYIANITVDGHDELLLLYYNYFTQNEQSEYFMRGYYLYKYQKKLTLTSTTLFLIAYAIARKTEDILRIKKIQNLFCKNDVDVTIKKTFKKTKKVLDDILANKDMEIILKDYEDIQDSFMDISIKAEITNEIFHYLYRRTPMDSSICLNILNQCISYAENELIIDTSDIDGISRPDETILRLQIIYEIAPCVLDQRNDYDKFNNLYAISKELVSKSGSNCQKGYAEYIQNIFNRKAFLFVNQAVCGAYYDKAKYYFQKNSIWVEYYITLVCEAGTDIVIQEFKKAITNCKKVEEECNKKQITLPQKEKLYNNNIIAEFLLQERDCQHISQAVAAARKAVKQLKKLLNDSKNASQFVIYTNICSLCLYSNNEKQYLIYKKKLEKLYGCKDISDVSNEKIDDFYRYYFAWFELFRSIQNMNWNDAETILEKLDGFVPALFKKQEVFWANKNNSVRKLIESRTSIDAYDFCNNLVNVKRNEQTLSKFFYRGLMVSDLQYTSYF